MAGSKSISKGKRGEREVARLLQPMVNEVYELKGYSVDVIPKLERNLVQTRSGGYDLIGLDWIALEVKFQEVLMVEQWWQQCRRQARADQMPVLFYRKSRCKWRVRMLAYLLPNGGELHPVDISIESFLDYFKNRLLWVLTHQTDAAIIAANGRANGEVKCGFD